MGLVSLLIPLEGQSAAGGNWSNVCSAVHEGFEPGQASFCSRALFPGLGPEWSWLNNQLAQAVIGALLVIGFWLWMSSGLKVVPTRKQVLGEMIYDLVRNGIARDILGHDFKRYVPLLLSLFSFILVNNLFGEMFFFMFPTFSKIGYPLGLAILAWFLYNAAGIKKWGFATYLRKTVLPEGVPVPLWILIIPLEFLSNVIVRPITLAMRLFANLFAGHLVVMVFVVGGAFLLTEIHDPVNGMPVPLIQGAGVVSLLFSVAIFALELLVACIQAYIFTVLTAQYVASATADAH